MKNINKKDLIGINPNSILLKEYKNSLYALSAEQLEISIGLILGNTQIKFHNKSQTFRIKFYLSNQNRDYLDHIYNLFSEWILYEPNKKLILNPLGNLIHFWSFQTISHKAFNPLAELFLTQNKKSIPDFLIKNHLTARGLAYWFMDQGGKLDFNFKNKSIILNTHSFTELEINNMAKELNEKFHLNVHVQSNKGINLLVINKDNYNLFIKLISPYVIPEILKILP